MSRARVVACVLTALAVSAATGCGEAVDSVRQALDDAGTEPSTSTTQPGVAESATIEVSVCADPTSSVEELAPGLAASVPQAFASAIERRVAILDQPSVDGSQPAIPALRLRLTTVAANSYLGRPLADLIIPSVRSLPPIAVNGDAASAGQQELDALARSRQVQEARSAMVAAIDWLRRVTIPPAPTSDPSGCLALMAELAPAPNTLRRLLVYVGDLEQIGEERWPSSFSGVEVLPVQVCANPEACESALTWLRDNVTSRGGQVGAAARPEDLTPLLETALGVPQ